MSVTVTIPDELGKRLRERAEAEGMSFEEFIARALAASLQQTSDPLDAFIGRFETGIRDLARRHDDYLAFVTHRFPGA